MRALGLLAFPALVMVSVPAIADEAKKPVPVQQPAVSVTCDWFEIWATHGKGTVDAAIPAKLGKRLGSAIKQNDYKLVSSGKTTLTQKKAENLKLGKGSASVTLVETVNKTQARLTVDFNAAKGKSTQQQLVSAGDWVVTSVNQSSDANAEAHVLAVGECK